MGPIEWLAASIEQHVEQIGANCFARRAPVSEVRAALEGLHAWAWGEVQRMARDPLLGARPELGRVRERVTSLLEVEIARYERAIGAQAEPPPAPPLPPLGPSLGSIFSNAQQSSKEVPWANQKYNLVGTLTCIHCGSPQQQPLDFKCKYCRRPIA
jgi:hypothetical protein